MAVEFEALIENLLHLSRSVHILILRCLHHLEFNVEVAFALVRYHYWQSLCESDCDCAEIKFQWADLNKSITSCSDNCYGLVTCGCFEPKFVLLSQCEARPWREETNRTFNLVEEVACEEWDSDLVLFLFKRGENCNEPCFFIWL